MSKCVIKHIHLLNELAKAKPSQRKEILKNANFGLIKSIVECIENVLNGNVKLDKNHIKKLKRHKVQLRKINSSDKKWCSKKKVIIQSGGAFLPALLLPLISVIASRLF